MSNLLQINASIFGQHGASTQITDNFVRDWKAATNGEVRVRDLSRQPVPHLTEQSFRAFGTTPSDLTVDQRAIVKYSDELIDELRDADIVVIALPLYNFGVPSSLQAYFDHVARAGITFRYTDKGPVGLLSGKKAIVFAARGGVHEATPRDTQSGHVRNFLSLLGITDVEIVYAEGLAMGAEQRKRALASAESQAADVIRLLRAA
ncbi:FMN-dependent NADH-azoreductase [Sinimarinibacterium flocculans]|uniref:FMN-dependent NADH-azoreductase n=1 Tax=Sinimarinibacterium flocculans TaxID=985250 RepID=UPI0024922D76|nr:NAD(P)H-dependent oxidoreductase [Sinimarinibacterium flocculans]